MCLVLAGAIAPFLTSCPESNQSGAAGGASGAAVGNAGSTSTEGFLVTKYAPLSKWLDERFDVDYKHMTPQLIFDQVPLNDIFYETSNLPTNAPPFNFASSDVSRRELLKRISNHWKLKMSLSLDAAGNPKAVRVEG
ncbi:MAG TPA: hypothetical protein PLA50_10105 [Bacteroidia bacterium]|nr:hypothetical protein [Bacteroidia bacterium]